MLHYRSMSRLAISLSLQFACKTNTRQLTGLSVYKSRPRCYNKRQMGSKSFPNIAAQAAEPAATVAESESQRYGKRKVALFIGYEGTAYRGLQKQQRPELNDTIEQLLESAIYKAGGILDTNLGNFNRLDWNRSSRTDKAVHSVATVVSMKMEVPIDAFDTDPAGQQIAANINSHLPEEIRVFGVQRVTKSFNARMECLRRVYNYYLPLTAVLKDSGVSEEEAVARIKDAWGRFRGHHAFHNFTNRRIYRDSNNSKKKKGKKGQVDDDDDEEEESGLEDAATASLTANAAGTGDSQASREPYDGINNRIRTIDIEWYSERSESDPLSKRHYRFMDECTVADTPAPILPGGPNCIKLTVKGGSFMLHQIRHMVGAVTAVARGIVPASLIDVALSAPARLSFPLAPAPTLLLSDVEFSPFRRSYDGKASSASAASGERLELLGPGVESRHAFENELLLPALNELAGSEVYSEWVDYMNQFEYDQAKIQEVLEEYSAWDEQRKAKKALKVQARAEAGLPE